MTTPVIENIATNILAAVNAITTTNGFNQTLVAQRLNRLPFLEEAWDDLTVLIFQSEETLGKELNGSFGVQELIEIFAIFAIVINSESSAIVLDTRLNQVASDIKKKLMESNTRGGYATDTKFAPSRFFLFNDSFTGIVVNCEVTYRVKLDDPYTKA